MEIKSTEKIDKNAPKVKFFFKDFSKTRPFSSNTTRKGVQYI